MACHDGHDGNDGKPKSNPRPVFVAHWRMTFPLSASQTAEKWQKRRIQEPFLVCVFAERLTAAKCFSVQSENFSRSWQSGTSDPPLPNSDHSVGPRSNARLDWFCWKLFDNLNVLHFSMSDQFSKCPGHGHWSLRSNGQIREWGVRTNAEASSV